MQRLFFVVVIGAAGISGCSDHHTPPSAPFRDDWVVAHRAPFPVLAPDGTPQILSLSVGGDVYMGNFANRGDVIVEYEDTTDITIELRKFTMADTAADAKEDFDALQLWAYDASGNPKPPGEMDEADNCAHVDGKTGKARPWPDACQIRVFYDGHDQLQRSGADLRVTLPRDFHQKLSITTTDDDVDADYHNRGDVCITNLAGTADVSMASGRAYATLAPDVAPLPACPPADVAACESWTADDGTPEPWATECPCFVNGDSFGDLHIESSTPSATEMIVDAPADLWAALTLRNDGTNSGPAATCGDQCRVTVNLGGYVRDANVADDGLHEKGLVNYPGVPVIAAGYGITLASGGCAPVSSTENPEDFVGFDNGSTEHTEEHGNLTVCSGCLQGMTCEEILAQKVAQGDCD